MGILAKEGNSFYKGKFFLGFIRYEMHLRNEIQNIHIGVKSTGGNFSTLDDKCRVIKPSCNFNKLTNEDILELRINFLRFQHSGIWPKNYFFSSGCAEVAGRIVKTENFFK